MKKSGSLVIIFLIYSSGFSQPTKVYSTKSQRKAFYQQFAQKYNSADIQEIWKSDKEEDFDQYVDGKTEKDLIASYSTVIHELLHGYNQSENDGHTYFIEKGIRIHVPYTEVFNSKELNKVVRSGLQDSIFRYGLYVGGKDHLPGLGKVKGVNNNAQNEAMSVQKGVYGLLEEFSAYYFGDLAAFEQYDYYLATYGKGDADAWENYTHEVYGDLVAYYEFQLFIGWYMHYAKSKHPQIYEEIQKNKAFKVVFTLIQDKFTALSDAAEKKCGTVNENKDREAVTDQLDFSGSDEDFIRFLILAGLPKEEVYEEKTSVTNGQTTTSKKIILDQEDLAELKEEYLSFAKELKKQLGGDDILMHFANNEKSIAYLKKQFTPEVNAELQKLRTEGVTARNYSDYLK